MKTFKLLFSVAFLLVASGEIFAQPANPSDPVPLDGGITLLLTAGAVYGAKKAYDKYKEKTV